MFKESFENLRVRMDQGSLPEGYIPSNSDDEVFTREEALAIEELFEKIEKTKFPLVEKIQPGKKILEQVDMEGRSLDGVKPYPLTIFADEGKAVVPKNPEDTHLLVNLPFRYPVLRIKKELLLPGNEELVNSVEFSHIDLNVWVLNKVPLEQRLRIVAAINNFQQQTGTVIKLSGNLHRG